jgi:hypothetical protein
LISRNLAPSNRAFILACNALKTGPVDEEEDEDEDGREEVAGATAVTLAGACCCDGAL